MRIQLQPTSSYIPTSYISIFRMHEICNEGFLVLKKVYLLRYMFEPAHSGNLLNHYVLLTKGDLRFSNRSFGSLRAFSWYQAKRRKVANSEALPFPRTLLLCQNLGWLFFGLRWTVRGKVGRHALLAMILYSIQRFAKMMTLIEIRGSIFWDSMAALPSC